MADRNPALRAKLDARLMIAMANRSPQLLAEGQTRITRGDHIDQVFGVIEGEVMVFRWAGFEILRLRRGEFAAQEPDA